MVHIWGFKAILLLREGHITLILVVYPNPIKAYGYCIIYLWAFEWVISFPPFLERIFTLLRSKVV